MIQKSLKAGYRIPQTKKYVVTDIGTPQGSVLSPLLSNIVLHELDEYMVNCVEPEYRKGNRRRGNPNYEKWALIRYNKKATKAQRDEALKQMLMTPRIDPHDPNYRRLYIRYADDFVILIEGPKDDAYEIRNKVKECLINSCGLELNEEKTVITHINEGFNFLGAYVKGLPRVGYMMRTKTVKGDQIRMRANIRSRINAPTKKMLEKLLKGKIARRDNRNMITAQPLTALVNMDHATIIQYYNSKINGIINYYSFAGNRNECLNIIWILRHSCAKTLARKYRMSTRQVFKRFGPFLEDSQTNIKLNIPRSLRAIHLYRVKENLNSPIDTLDKTWFGRLTQTNVFKSCILCGTSKKIQMHHLRSVKDVRIRIKKKGANFKTIVGAFQRKQIPLCQYHHTLYHQGKLLNYEMKALAQYSDNLVDHYSVEPKK
jgi:hypothetical protein